PCEDSAIRALHVASKMPIFLLAGGYHEPHKDSVLIDCMPPNLGELRFASVLPAEQIWQELSYWLSNLINESPDMMPPPRPPMTNLEKIEAHGFDKKVSFRRRKPITA